MKITPNLIVNTDWDEVVYNFASKFNAEEWERIVNETEQTTVKIDGVPDEIIRVLVSLFGIDRAIQFLSNDKPYRNEPIIDFLRTYPDKELATKAVIFIVTKLYKRRRYSKGITPNLRIDPDWDKIVYNIASKFNEEEWERIVNRTEQTTVKIDGVPDEIIRVLVSLFGIDRAIQWFSYYKTYRNEPIIDFLRTYPDKELATKAVIFIVIKLYKNNCNDAFLAYLKTRYGKFDWDFFIKSLEKEGYYQNCSYTIDNVEQSIVNIVFSSKLYENEKFNFFNTPIYDLHGLTPIELSENDEGKESLRLYMIFEDHFRRDPAGM